MLALLFETALWLQPAATGGGSTGGGGDAAASSGSAGGMGCAMQAGLFAVMMVVFYLFLLRPEQKRRKEHDDMLKSIRRGTKVRTSGGILGEVVRLGDDDVDLLIADRVKVNVLRSHVAAVVGTAAKAPEPEAEPKKKKAKRAATPDAPAEATDEA